MKQKKSFNLSHLKAMHLALDWGANQKMRKTSEYIGVPVVNWDMLAGYTCPAAHICKSFAQKTGGVKMAPGAHVLCYAARDEGLYKNLFARDQRNTLASRKSDFVQLVNDDIKVMLENSAARGKYRLVVRIHASGDMYSPEYLEKWISVVKANPRVMFFGYTKVYAAYARIKAENLPNMKFAFSIGSLDDSQVQPGDVTCTIVTKSMKFHGRIVCDENTPVSESADYRAIISGKSFGIKIH